MCGGGSVTCARGRAAVQADSAVRDVCRPAARTAGHVDIITDRAGWLGLTLATRNVEAAMNEQSPSRIHYGVRDVAAAPTASPVAVLVCHGMGQQVRYETISAVANAIRIEAEKAGGVAEPLDVRLGHDQVSPADGVERPPLQHAVQEDHVLSTQF